MRREEGGFYKNGVRGSVVLAPGGLSATRTKDGTAFELNTVTDAASEWIEGSDDSWWHPINEKPKKQ